MAGLEHEERCLYLIEASASPHDRHQDRGVEGSGRLLSPDRSASWRTDPATSWGRGGESCCHGADL